MDESLDVRNGVPMPIVRLNRWLLVSGVVAGVATQQPLWTTLLLLLLLPSVLFGQARSPVAWVGRRVLRRWIPGAEHEDRRLMRFNNAIAVLLLGGAQIAFLAGAPLVGWLLAGMVAVAASIALAGFCVGCFLYFQFKVQRYRLFGQ